MIYYGFNRQELLQKEIDRYHNCGSKETAAEYYVANKDVMKEICQKTKKKQEGNMEEIGIKILKENASLKSINLCAS